MLDVMRRPPPVGEQITWVADRVQRPDSDTTVLVYLPDDETEPVWLGFWDDADDAWKSVEGFRIGMVTWWAHLPAGPQEPKPAGHAG